MSTLLHFIVLGSRVLLTEDLWKGLGSREIHDLLSDRVLQFQSTPSSTRDLYVRVLSDQILDGDPFQYFVAFYVAYSNSTLSCTTPSLSPPTPLLGLPRT